MESKGDEMSECPECGLEWTPSGVQEAEIVTCPDCGTELEVVGIDPLRLAPAPKVEEDWGE